MRSIVHRNVNDVFRHAIGELLKGGEVEESRNGNVTVYPSPVAVTYLRPWERVLFSKTRRANPFFHLFESFWMIAGREDAQFLDRYVSDFSTRFAELGGILHGAYGYRWRSAFAIDQIEWCIDLLLREPASRRAVIQMYHPPIDSIRYGDISPKDIPCNTQIYLRVKPSVIGRPQFKPEDATSIDHPPDIWFPDQTMPVLELTVCCRSNDAIWGAYGANAVHFSVLQEYIAWRLDARMGPMHQLSNNLHIYDSTRHLYNEREPRHDKYATDEVSAVHLFNGTESSLFHGELHRWLEDPSNVGQYSYDCIWPFSAVLIPMSQTHDLIRMKKWALAEESTEFILAPDWQAAARQWIETRAKKTVDA